MSLDVYVSDTPVPDRRSDLRLCFEDDGYYWYCQPYFAAMAIETGRSEHDIDLYGAAWFQGDDLDRLDACIQRVRSSLAAEPDAFDVSVAAADVSAGPPSTPHAFRSRVDRQTLADQLETLAQAVADARAQGRGVCCFGD